MAKRHSNNGRLIPAVSCIRMSSDKQDASPDQQRQEIAKLAERDGYHILREYFDDAVSGDNTAKRKAFQRMIADAEKLGDFKAILCWDQDRFGRFDSIEAGRWIHPLRQAGVHLNTVAQGVIDWSDFASRMIYGITQEAKHAFLRDLSRNSLRGLLAAAKRGEWINKRLYGYHVENKRLVLGPAEEVETVRRIFREYLAGHSIRQILLALNAEGIRTQSGRRWSPNTLRDKLKNAAYCGRFVWHVERKGKYHSVRDGEITSDFERGPCDPSEWIVIEDNHPALIDVDTFERAQRKLSERQKLTTPGDARTVYLFTGICRCGKCGGNMEGITQRGTPRLQCANHVHKGMCDRNGAGQDELLDNVLGAIEGRFTNPRTVQRMRDLLAKRVRKATAEVDADSLRRELAKLDAKLGKARRNMALADGDDLRLEYEAVVRELRQDRERLEISLQNAQKPRGRTLAEHDARIEKAINLFSRLRESLSKAPAVAQRELLRTAIEKVEIWSERDPKDGRGTFRLQRGKVHLRPEMWFASREDLSGYPRRSGPRRNGRMMGVPSTNSITKYGRPESVLPPSRTVAMDWWSIMARACRKEELVKAATDRLVGGFRENTCCASQAVAAPLTSALPVSIAPSGRPERV